MKCHLRIIVTLLLRSVRHFSAQHDNRPSKSPQSSFLYHSSQISTHRDWLWDIRFQHFARRSIHLVYGRRVAPRLPPPLPSVPTLSNTPPGMASIIVVAQIPDPPLLPSSHQVEVSGHHPRLPRSPVHLLIFRLTFVFKELRAKAFSDLSKVGYTWKRCFQPNEVQHFKDLFYDFFFQ